MPQRIDAEGLALRHWPGWLDHDGAPVGQRLPASAHQAPVKDLPSELVRQLTLRGSALQHLPDEPKEPAAHRLHHAQALLAQLLAEVPWRQELITLFGRTHPLPRLTCWVADPGCHYTYSGLRNQPEPWTPPLEALRQQLGELLGCRFNSLLLNRYRHGGDRMGWHADDERELDAAAPIASLSLGASRSFRLRPKHPGRLLHPPLGLELGHGDLLVMDPPSQRHWLHALPARLKVTEERLNLTFRVIGG